MEGCCLEGEEEGGGGVWGDLPQVEMDDDRIMMILDRQKDSHFPSWGKRKRRGGSASR